VPNYVKWGILAALAVVCAGAAYLMVLRGPALLLDLKGALVACF